MKRGLLIGLCIASVVAAREMPTLPKGAKPKTWKDVKAVLKPLGWEVKRPEVAEDPGLKIHQDLQYASRKERNLKLDLYLPEIGNPPLVVIIHGGGWKKGSKESQRSQSVWFANRGYAVAAIQYRLSSEALFPAAINDCNAAIDWLKDRAGKYGFDSSRIAVWGGSAGAHLAALVGVTNPDVSAAMVVAGPTDLTREKVQEVSSDPESNYHMFFGGSFSEKAKLYEQASPFLQVGQQTPPMLVIAENSLDSPEKIIQKLEVSNVYYETMILSGGIHGHWNWEPWFTPVMERCDQFLKRVYSKENRDEK